MADETLRMQAEVQDKFSGPLKALRAQLLDVTRAGANNSEALAKGFKGVEGAIHSTAKTATTVLNPAFAAIGVTGLTAGAAVAGITNALNKLTGNLSGLGQLSRETGVAAKTLQEFGAVSSRFGVSQDTVATATKNFAAQMRTFSIGTGDAFKWVMQQGRDASGRKAFQDFATDLQKTGDEGEKLKKALSFMETIKNPVERGIFARQFFGNEDLGRLADGHLGPIADLFKKAREKIGVFNPDDILNAEKFDRAAEDLKSSMQKVGNAIARELLGPATQFTAWIDDIASGHRKEFTDGLRQGIGKIKEALGEINWYQAGEDAKTFLTGSTALAGKLAESIRAIASAIRSFNDGKPLEALRHLDGGSGPLARRLAPLPGDDKLELNEQAGAVSARIARAREQGGFQSELLKDLEERGDKEGAKRLREAMEANNRELKSLEDALKKLTDQGAVISKSSAEGGPFGGATVQTAAFGGFGRPGRPLPPFDPAQYERRRQAGMGNYGNPDAGWFGGRGGADARAYGGGRPGISPIGPRPDVPVVAPPGGYPGISARDMKSVNPEMAEYIRRSAIAHGIDPNVALRIANSEGLRGSIPGVRNTPGDKGTSFGPFQLHYGSNIPGVRNKGLGDRYTAETGHHASDPKYWKEQIDFALRTARKEGWGAWHGRYGARIGVMDGIGAVRPVPMTEQRSAVTGHADGAGWAAREAARKTYATQQAEAAGLRLGGARVAAAAAQAGVAGMPKVEVSGSVTNVIERPGPDTRIRSSASGRLFQDVVQRSGAQMRRAD